jgi:hypothetical protein
VEILQIYLNYIIISHWLMKIHLAG